MRKKRKDNKVRDNTTYKASKVAKAKKKKIAVKPRVPRTRNAGTMTESQYFSRISAALRDAFRFWKPMTSALSKVRRPYNGKNKLIKFEYQCAKCKSWFIRTQVQIDHIIPCGSLRSYDDIVPFIIRLTEENENGYQVLCKKDHMEKTKKEVEQRKQERLIKNKNNGTITDNLQIL